jgi:hypothetical protein
MQCIEQKTSSPGVRIFKAIERDQVLCELRAWAAEQRAVHPQVRKLGLFGSYATGRYAPGSDIDPLVIVAESDEPRWFMRGTAFDIAGLSVGADPFRLHRGRGRPPGRKQRLVPAHPARSRLALEPPAGRWSSGATWLDGHRTRYSALSRPQLTSVTGVG